MILEVSRGHIKVELGGRVATVPGEMFFPPDDKLGFAVFKDQISAWDAPHELDQLTSDDVRSIIDEIEQDFAKGGHTLVVE